MAAEIGSFYSYCMDGLINFGSFGRKLENTRRPEDPKGFVALTRDYERTLALSEAIAYLASIHRMLKLATN